MDAYVHSIWQDVGVLPPYVVAITGRHDGLNWSAEFIPLEIFIFSRAE